MKLRNFWKEKKKPKVWTNFRAKETKKKYVRKQIGWIRVLLGEKYANVDFYNSKFLCEILQNADTI